MGARLPNLGNGGCGYGTKVTIYGIAALNGKLANAVRPIGNSLWDADLVTSYGKTDEHLRQYLFG